MREGGLVARARKRFKTTTMSDHDQPVAANLLDRRFETAGANERWVGDTTELVVGSSGKLYLAAVLAARMPGCFTTPTRAAPTRAKTIRRS